MASPSSLASGRFPAEAACMSRPSPSRNSTPTLPAPGRTSEGLQEGVSLGAGSPTAEAGSWSSCAGRFCRGWRVAGSSAGDPRSRSPEVGRPYSPAGWGSYTASHWAGRAAPHLPGPSGLLGKGCPALRRVPVRRGHRWLSPAARSWRLACLASRASAPPSHSLGRHPRRESWPPVPAWERCCGGADDGVCRVGCSQSLASHGCGTPRAVL